MERNILVLTLSLFGKSLSHGILSSDEIGGGWMDGLEISRSNVGIDLSRAKRGMAREFLNVSDIGAAMEKMGRK